MLQRTQPGAARPVLVGAGGKTLLCTQTGGGQRARTIIFWLLSSVVGVSEGTGSQVSFVT